MTKLEALLQTKPFEDFTTEEYYGVAISQYITAAEARIKDYGLQLKDWSMSRVHLLTLMSLEEYDSWKAQIRELSNFEETTLKHLVDLKKYYNQGMNPPSFYPYKIELT